MLTNQRLSTPTAPDSSALLDPRRRGLNRAVADATPSASIEQLQSEVTLERGSIPHPWKRHDARLGDDPVCHDGGGLAAQESNWSQALRMLGLK